MVCQMAVPVVEEHVSSSPFPLDEEAEVDEWVRILTCGRIFVPFPQAMRLLDLCLLCSDGRCRKGSRGEASSQTTSRTVVGWD